ncbi:MAG: peroxide stress protein YaaA [Flavobacteriales bacterium]|nr:peroxide stress protein YaaA [Flavobacteriales bacterium]
MLTVISPAKRLDFETEVCTEKHTIPDHLDRSELLINKLKRTSKAEIQKLMGLSTNLAELNVDRYASWTSDFNTGITKQALLAFKGDVYRGMENDALSVEDLDFAQEHLRILSGLHGMLRPLDLIRPHRLEMGTNLAVNRKKDLYAFWGDTNVDRINEQLSSIGSDFLVNLASNEYFKSVNTKKLRVKIITPVFKDLKNDQLRVISIFAKVARGMMTGYILRNRITQPEELKLFDGGGYRYTENLSDDNIWVFTR